MKYKVYYMKIDKFSEKDIEDLKAFRKVCADYVILEFDNLRLVKEIDKFLAFDKIMFKVNSGYNHFHNEKYDDLEFTKNQNIYTKEEFIKIFNKLKEFRNIYLSDNLLINAFIIYNEIIKKIKYRKNGENNLKCLISGEASSLGVSFLLKECLDFINVPNKMLFLKDTNYAINALRIMNKEFLLDLARDMYNYENSENFKINYFSCQDMSRYYKMTPINKKEKVESLDHFVKIGEKTIDNLSKYIYTCKEKIKVNNKEIIYANKIYNIEKKLKGFNIKEEGIKHHYSDNSLLFLEEISNIYTFKYRVFYINSLKEIEVYKLISDNDIKEIEKNKLREYFENYLNIEKIRYINYFKDGYVGLVGGINE